MRRLPPEWAPQAATLLAWPRAQADWGDGLGAARDAIAGMAKALAARQPVLLIAADAECAESIAAHAALARLGADRLTIVSASNNDVWIRDTGPLTVFEDSERVFVDFRFDGWGGKFDAVHDDRLTAALYARGALGAGRLERRDAVLEGGSIEADGRGGLLTTTGCLLQGRRNRGLDRAGAQALLRDALGATRVHWLANGELIGDDTDGHIDTLARFAGPDTIIHQGCRDPNDAHYGPLAAMAEELAALRDADARPYRLIELPLPQPVYDPDDGHRLPAGYANVLIANHAVLVPVFDDAADDEACALIGGCFADRQIVPVDARALIRQHGSLHCAAMQIPAEARCP